MRFIWRGLFWIGDGGWARDLTATTPVNVNSTTLRERRNLTEILAEMIRHYDVSGNLTTAAGNDSAVEAASPSMVSSLVQALNFTKGEPVGYSSFKRFILDSRWQLPASFENKTNITSFHSATDRLPAHMEPSLLSGVPLFSSLTPSSAINRLILDILEGQIITLLVLVAFILIFLIREWVVQQQPVINMAAINAQNARRGPQQHAGAGEDMQAPDDAGRGNAPRVPPNSEAASGAASPAHVEAEQERDTVRGSSSDETSVDPNRRHIVASAGEGQSSGQVEPIPERVTVDATGEIAGSSRSSTDACFKKLELTKLLPQGFFTAIRESRTDDAQAIYDSLPPEAQVEVSEEVQRLLAPLREQNSVRPSEKVISEQSGQSQIEKNDPIDLNTYPRARPQMPSRDQSFLATTVMRNIEENGSARSSHEPGEQLSKKDNTSNENMSENSSESWQHLSGSEDEKNAKRPSRTDSPRSNYQTFITSSASSKGKNKVTDIDDEARDTSVDSEHSRMNMSEDTEADSLDDHQSQVADATTNPLHPDLQGDLSEGGENIQTGLAVEENEEVESDTPHSQRGNADAGPSWVDKLLDWLWGEAAPPDPGPQAPGQDDEEVLEEGHNGEQENFVHVVDGRPALHVHDNDEGAQDPEVLAAAQQAGVDPDPAAAEDAEDLEGIMELIGMQGPLTGLIQNAMFGAFLISATVAGAVWFPYLWGKLVIMFLGSPISLLFRFPIALVSGTTDLVADACLFFGGSLVHWGMKATRVLFLALGWAIPVFASDYEVFNNIATFARSVGEHALDRIAVLIVSAGLSFDADCLHLSLKSHAALRGMQNILGRMLSFLIATIVTFCRSLADNGVFKTLWQGSLHIPEFCLHLIEEGGVWSRKIVSSSLGLLQAIISTAPEESKAIQPLDPSLAYWSATDRLLAVLAGYGFFAIAGALYLRRGSYFTTSQQGRKIEGMITEILQQAGGVMKVIFIISIEMIVFPLYCGILLDIALLPLCEGATVLLRVDWTLQSPWTSGFVHWFIGTCYMFHFALFVSMCRKIMRNGVLYFIRDPDDPTFHPVRDVLERNVSTQLRKITFSALVYGGLVIVCLGGVVWSLTYCFDNVLPIRWSANEPFFEFPIDLLLYNFLTPLVLKTLQPSQALHSMYEWWFRRCARLLRLSQFFFGERRADEEGHHIHTSLTSFFAQIKGETAASVASEDNDVHEDGRQDDPLFLRDGRYVRAPASDQVRIPKGRAVFLEVDENNKRLDGLPDDDEGIHGRENEQFEIVYIPPWFRVRIGLFIGCLWIFAAVTGIGLTIVPLVFGRRFFSICLDDATRINDIYAFCFGLYTLGGVGYCLVKARAASYAIRRHLKEIKVISSETIQKAKYYATRTAKVVYTYSAFAVLVPCIFALILELYFILPLHSYVQLTHRAAAANRHPTSPILSSLNGSFALNSSTTLPTSPNIFDSRHFTQAANQVTPSSSLPPPLLAPHVLHILQSWTLGLLYFRLTLRVLLALPTARAARALRAVIRRGWWDPDVALATRGFVLPLFIIAVLVVAGPPFVAAACVKTWTWLDRLSKWFSIEKFSLASTSVRQSSATSTAALGLAIDEDAMALLYRFSYPVTLAAGMSIWGAWSAIRALGRWRRRIRDEVYLVGERLHNFGETRVAGMGTHGRRGSGRSDETVATDEGHPRPGVDLPRAPPAVV